LQEDPVVGDSVEDQQNRKTTQAPDAGRHDPAERSRSLRVFYTGWRPTRLGRIVNRLVASLSAHGLTPQILLTLQVKGRNSGQLHNNVLVPVLYGGRRYFVSMLGDRSEWVRNVRAARGEAFIKRRHAVPVKLTEIPPEERAPILKAYCQVATSGRHHLPVLYNAPVAEFEPVASDYPVFRIDPRTH
jgi:hypothetical protein